MLWNFAKIGRTAGLSLTEQNLHETSQIVWETAHIICLLPWQNNTLQQLNVWKAFETLYPALACGRQFSRFYMLNKHLDLLFVFDTLISLRHYVCFGKIINCKCEMVIFASEIYQFHINMSHVVCFCEYVPKKTHTHRMLYIFCFPTAFKEISKQHE